MRKAHRDSTHLVETSNGVGIEADVQARGVIAELPQRPRAEDGDHLGRGTLPQPRQSHLGR